jgi:hypothetical protein
MNLDSLGIFFALHHPQIPSTIPLLGKNKKKKISKITSQNSIPIVVKEPIPTSTVNEHHEPQ